eukprot:CAMPEP_0181424492 /NCGR_PEP_ID=MMETSP1110-20121109/14674_1 /TAXON_ID=174948 /ORGANISM="Symbiodinium sp., Strain CCMP421" /LENGTH=315 /DNA_ID=CAMNT_0023547655 /DNA_START=86 /DNA_END=1033 /DNA_ORIENTATION=+
MMLLKAAFYPPPRVGVEEGSRFALLPQQTEDELAISEVHSRLDRALKFLQRDVGYTLLDDALADAGGVRLRHRQLEAPFGFDLPARGTRSCKLPKERPSEHDEADDILCCKPEIGKYAHFKDDIVLVWRFAALIHGLEQDSEEKGLASPGVKHDTLYKKVLQGIRLMHLCDYHYADVVLTLAYASVYFRSAFTAIGQKMSDYEAAHVCVLLIYLAHSFLLDETCPLRVWQQHIFKKYCNLKVLDAALFRIFKMRGFRLRITEAEEKQALSVLLLRTNGLHDANGASRRSSSSSKGVQDHVNVDIINCKSEECKHA